MKWFGSLAEQPLFASRRNRWVLVAVLTGVLGLGVWALWPEEEFQGPGGAAELARLCGIDSDVEAIVHETWEEEQINEFGDEYLDNYSEVEFVGVGIGRAHDVWDYEGNWTTGHNYDCPGPG